MAKRILLVALIFLAAALIFFGDHFQDRRVIPDARDCPHDPEQLYVPAGEFIMGSSAEEREYAYALDNEVTRAYRWYEKETRMRATTGAYCIDRYPVTNSEYKRFIDETGHPEPYLSPEAYQHQGFLVHPYAKVKEFLWTKRSFPPSRESHPVTLVSLEDAKSHCSRRGEKMARSYRLPTETEWERAARGTDGRIFPWGNEWNPEYLNSGNRFGSTTPAGQFPQGRSPYGVYDMVGNAFEWTATPWDDKNSVVKGCSWDDLPGTCRAAMRHGRPPQTKHILIGFRCVSDK